MNIYQKAFLKGIGRIFTLPRLSIPLIITLGLTLGAVLSVIAISSSLLYQPLKGVKNEQSIDTYSLRVSISKDISASFWNTNRLADINEKFKDQGIWAAISASEAEVNIDDINFGVTRYFASNTILDVLGTQLIKGEGVSIANPEKYIWISNSLWQQAFGGADSAIGRIVKFADQDVIIAGVLEDLMAVQSEETIIGAQI
ncbi:MAG: ABC transporter permease [Psychrosphaera sp.]|nr:ABC transporter permease [Psychrosphaera sp.]